MKMKYAWILALPLLAGCAGVIELKSRAGASAGGPTGKPVLYDDFEKGLGGTWNYAAPEGAACNPAEESTDVHSGTKAAKCEYKSGSGTWGCGFGWTSSQMPKEGYYNATGTQGIEFWAKGPIGATFQFSLKESTQGGGDGEVYLGPWVTATGRWKKYYVKYDAFTRGIYSGNQSGDDQLVTGGLGSIDIQFQEKQGNGVLVVDDIWFK